MGLHARIAPGATDKIPVHRLSAGLGEYIAGNITKAALVNALNLSAAEGNECDAIKATYDAFAATTAGNIQRAAFLWQIERAFILSETGDYTEAKAKAVLGF